MRSEKLKSFESGLKDKPTEDAFGILHRPAVNGSGAAIEFGEIQQHRST